MKTDNEIAVNQFLVWQSDIIAFVVDGLGIETLEPYQEKALRTMANSKKVVITSCHDVGKTFLLALFFLWALYTHAYSTVITTAPSFSAVRNLLWREIAKRWRESRIDLEGTLLDTRLEISGDKWFGIGLSPRRDSDSNVDGSNSNFQGYHNKYVFILFDEASGVHSRRWEAAKSMLTSANTWFIAIGNPLSPTGSFKQAVDGPFYETIRLSCFDSPNLKVNKIKNINDIREEGQKLQGMGPDKARERMAKYKIVHPELLTLQWVMEQYLEEGEDSPFFQSRVMGNFPKEGENSLVSYSSIQYCMDEENIEYKSGKIIAGCDVARFGDDATIIYVMDGNKVILRKTYNKKDTVYVSEQCAGIIAQYNVQEFGIDDTGLNGVTDQLRAMRTGCTIHSYIASKSPKNKKRFINVRAESFWMLANDIKKEEIILLPDDKKILSQLPSMNYEYKDTRIKIEPKSDIKRRIGRSPDNADALCICNYVRKGAMKTSIGSPISLEQDEVLY